MATIHSADLLEVIVDGAESAKSLNRPGLQRLLALINAGQVQAVIMAKLDRLTRSVKDLCNLLKLFEKRKVALISVAESLASPSRAACFPYCICQRSTDTSTYFGSSSVP